jgi:glutathione S-transferase kappa 1
MKLELFYDIVSPYSYLAMVVLDRYRAPWSLDLVLRPAFLGGVMKSVGNVPPATLPQRAPYLLRDIARLSRHVGVEMTLPEEFPGQTLQTMRFLRALEDDVAAKGDPRALFDVSMALYRAHWGKGAAVNDPETILAAAIAGGLDEGRARALLARIGDADVKEKLKASGDEVVARGAFGFPAMFVTKDGDDELFFGHDRISLLAFEMGLPWHGPRP